MIAAGENGRSALALFVFSLVLLISSITFSATLLRPAKDHRWHTIMSNGLPSAQAVRCRDCRADLVLRCVRRGRGLLELTLPGAAVSNGRAGATKQIRLTFGSQQLRRRAMMHRQSNGYTPVVELGVDDPLLDRMSAGGVLKISFYGQRSVVGLRDAAAVIGRVRKACRPSGQRMPGRHCIWAAVITCSSDRHGAEATRKRVPRSFIRETTGSYCVTLASEALATAKAHVGRHGGHVERSCVR